MTLLKTRKIGLFAKGDNHWFCQHIKISFSFFFFKIGLNILFDDLQKRKQPFLDYKHDVIKKSKNWTFCEGVNPWF